MVTAPTILSSQIRPLGVGVAGTAELERLVVAGLTVTDDHGTKLPQLGEAVPSIENGGWQVLSDGRMTTAWTISSKATWHDGAPITAEDLLFTLDVVRDRDVAAFRQQPLDWIESAEATGPRSVVVTWNRPFIGADGLFDLNRSQPLALPRPKHILEEPFLRDRASFTSLPYWNEEFVGSGPFRVARWETGVGVLLQAHDGFAPGRPKIDEIDVKFIQDPSTLAANILAGAVDMTIGRTMALDQALEVRDRWKDGSVTVGDLDTVMLLYPQLLTPNPAVIGDVRFRRALLQATDRQEIVDTLQPGFARVADAYLSPNDEDFPGIEPSIVRYPFDPRQAAEAIAALGYVRDPSGAFRDAAGQPLGVEIRTTRGQDLQQKTVASTADYWQRVGVAVSQVLVPPELAEGREYRATMPGFDMKTQPGDTNFLNRVHSSKTPLPENNFVGNNYNRYVNADFDALIDRYYTTIPRADRLQRHGQIIHQMTDQVLYLTLFIFGHPTLFSNRLTNVTPSSEGWNANEWTLAS